MERASRAMTTATKRAMARMRVRAKAARAMATARKMGRAARAMYGNKEGEEEGEEEGEGNL